MPANKMPEMPTPIHSVEVFTDAGEQKTYQADADYYTADQMRAMWLAGIADARECVPGRRNNAIGTAAVEWNACRATTLTNLTALEQEAKK